MTEPLWQWDELIAAAGARAEGTPVHPVSGFSIDTRTLRSGDVFVALKAERDGHVFVPAAFAAGAAAALVSNDYVRGTSDGPVLRVADPLAALEAIGNAARTRSSARIVAVTGSVGKTGSKEMLRLCLSDAGATHASEKSYNNHWGVPLTLARMPRGTQYGVLEIGMNHAGEITPLTRLVRPHVTVITQAWCRVARRCCPATTRIFPCWRPAHPRWAPGSSASATPRPPMSAASRPAWTRAARR
jgi:UDP-N-acetylmuramoyl-tripeptide--D-alanyl-D-alanine ligase